MNKIKHNPKLTFRLFLALYILGGLVATSLSIIYQYNKEYVGIAFLIGALVAVLLKYNHKNAENEIYKERFTNLFKISIVIFVVLCFMLIYVFMNSLAQYYLPLEYFIIIFLISGVILSQILLINELETFKEKIIFLEIIFMGIIVSSVFLFLFPSPYGNDAPYHVEFINNSINAGFLIGQGQYQNYPIFHLLFIYIVELCKIENFKIVQFILLIVQSSFLLFGFMLTKKIFNSKIALITILVLSFAPYISQPKYFYFPGAFTAILFLLSLYLVFYPKNISPSYSLLILISFLTIIFAHPLTPVILIAALVLLFFTSKFQSNKEKISITALLLILIVTVSWWMKPSGIAAKDLFSYSILSIKNAVETVDFTAVGRATLAPLINQNALISADLGSILLIALAITGSLYLIGSYAYNPAKYKDFKINSTYLAVITLIFIPIPYILTIVYPLSLPNRWFPFIEIFASIFAGFAIYVIFNNIRINKAKYGAIIGASFLIFLLVSNPVINPNSHLYSKELSVRTALTTSEIDSSIFINQYSNASIVKGNSKYIAFINPNAQSSNYIDPDNSTSINGLVVLRNYDMDKGFTIPLFGAKNKLLDTIIPSHTFYDTISHFNEIYDNGNLTMYSGDN